MTSHSEFLRRCDPSFENHGFDRAAFMALLGVSGDATPIPAPATAKWERGLHLRGQFTVDEAACIIEGRHPDEIQDWRGEPWPRGVASMRQAIMDAWQELGVDTYGCEVQGHHQVSHQSIAAWCARRGIPWPLSPTLPQGAATDTCTDLAQRLAAAEAKAEHLGQELAAALAERDDLWQRSFDESELLKATQRQRETELEQWKAKARELQAVLCFDDGPDIQASSESRRRQIGFIVATAQALGYNPLSIPDGGKQEIRAACLTLPKLFTEASFGHAWKAASDYVRMANHAHFAKR